MSPAPARSRRRDARRAPAPSRRPSVENLEHRLLLAAQLLGDLNPQGAASGPEGFGSVERHFAHLGDVTYFTADDGAHGTELWKADRTTGDVSLVRDLVPGAEPSSPLGLTVFRDALWFLTPTAPPPARRPCRKTSRWSPTTTAPT